MNNPLSILHVEDNITDSDYIAAVLSEAGVVCEITRVDTKNEFLQLIGTKKFDLILSDYKLPSFNGIQALKIVKEKIPETPFILLSGTIGEEFAIESLLNGATDYVLKDNIKRLVPAIQRAMKEVELRQEKARADEKLRESEKSLRHLINTATEIIYSIDTSGRITDANPATQHTLQYTLAELQQLNFYDLIVPEHRQRVASMYQRQLHNALAATFMEVPLRSKTDDVKWLGQNASVRMENDTVTGLNIIARDITEQKKTEAALLESEERFRRFFTASPDAIFLIDPHDPTVPWNIIDCNNAACAMNGYSREELIGKSIDIVNVSKPTMEERNAYVDNLRQKGVVFFETFHRHKDGHIFPIEFSNTLVTIQGREIILGIDRDISVRKRMEQSLQSIITNVRCILWYARVVRKEDAFEWILRVSNEDAAQQFLPLNIIPGETYSDAWRRAKFDEELPQLEKDYKEALEQKKKGYSHEFRCRTANGSVRWLYEDVSITPLTPGEWEFVGVCTDITEKKKTEAALVESQERFQRLFTASPDAILLIDPHDTHVSWPIIDCNEAACIMNGYTREELIGKSIDILNVKTGSPEERKAYLESLRNKSIAFIETYHRHKDGHIFPIEVSTSIVTIQGREIILGIDRDISERKRTEEALRMNESLLSSTVTIARLGHWQYDVASDLFTFNDHFYAMLRTTVEQEGGYTMSSLRYAQRFVHPDDMHLVGEEIKKALETTDPNYTSEIEHRFFYADGESGYVNVRIFVVKDENGRTIRTYGVNQDITERKLAEEELLRQTTYFQQLFDNSPEGIILLDEHNHIVNANSAFEKMFGYTLPEIAGKNVDDFIVPQEKREEALRLTKETAEGKSIQKDTVRKRKDGTLLDVIVIGYPIIIKNKQVGAYGMYLDISERKRLEEQLVHAQRMESIGTLAGGVAHDFNNILGIVMGHATLMEQLPQDAEKQKKNLQTILQATQRGATLVRQLLTFARKNQVFVESVKIEHAVNEVVKLLSETLPKTITLKTYVEDSLPEILVDSTQLQQVLLNLCVNARDAMPSGGTLTITCSAVQGEPLQKQFIKATHHQYVVIEVADTGTGMDEETRKRIFEPFFTTKEKGKGTGLGLAVVFGIVENHEGFIDVSSELGKGTTFSIYFPVKAAETQKEEPKKESAASSLRGTETLLVIEDEALLKELLTAMLTAKGYTVFSAANGEEGVELYAQHGQDIDLVISDFGLPKFDGFEVLKRLQKINPNVKFVLATGFIEPEQRSSILQQGARDIIQKPYTPESVMKAIRGVFDAHSIN